MKYILGTIFFVGLIALSLWWSVAQYRECRAMKFSQFYCVQHAF